MVAGSNGQVLPKHIMKDFIGAKSREAPLNTKLIGTGPYRVVSADRPLAGTTAFPLKRGATGRYVLVWLTALPSATGEGRINEVRALSR